MSKRKILVIDDEQDFLGLVTSNLEKTNEYEVRAESIARRAVAVAIEFKPDLILLDINMPDMDGGEVASQIRSQSELKYIPLVFLTALVRKDEASSREEYLDKHNFITKLPHKEQLIDCIEGLLLGRKKK